MRAAQETAYPDLEAESLPFDNSPTSVLDHDGALLISCSALYSMMPKQQGRLPDLCNSPHMQSGMLH